MTYTDQAMTDLIAGGLAQAIEELTETMGELKDENERLKIAGHILDFRQVWKAMMAETPVTHTTTEVVTWSA